MLLIGLQQNQSREWDTIHQEGDMKKSYHPLDAGRSIFTQITHGCEKHAY